MFHLSLSLHFLFHLLSSFSSCLFSSLSSSLSSINRSPRSPLAGRFLGWLSFFLGNDTHSEKVCSSPKEKGEPPGRFPNSQGNNEHSGNCLSFTFIFFHLLSLFFPFFSSCSSFFLGCSFFWPRLPHDFPLKLLITPLGPLFFSSLFFIFFIFVFFFNFFPCFSFFSCVFLFSFFIRLFPFCFPLKKMFLPFSCCFLFSFLGCSKSVAALQDSLKKSAHSELALFALYWFVVTFPCGIVHILVMIRLRVAYGGRRVGQAPPSHQIRQKSALDETADALQSSPFSLLSSLVLCFIFSLVLSCLVLSCLVLSSLLSCLVLSCLVLSCLVLSCLVLSCLVLSCLVLSCLVLSCLVLSLSSSLVRNRHIPAGWSRSRSIHHAARCKSTGQL